MEYTGRGTDWLFVDTFADLQTKLPEDVKIACCMTCRHGNFCPYGNQENQLFCTKGLDITEDSINGPSVCSVERAVTAFDVCRDFVYQSDAFYTYNDYLFVLREKEKPAE